MHQRSSRETAENEPELRASISPSRLRVIAVFCAFALSGCAGLIYQSIWAQYLGLFLGHAAYAQSLVLAIFMGGMAIGAWWVSTRTKTLENLLRGYAWVELCIGLAAAIFHPAYVAATQFAYDHGLPALAGVGSSAMFKWLLAGLLIFPQSVLLGATFPLMSNALIRRVPAGSGRTLGGVYFCNSIGAAAGALLATFVLLPAVGLPGAMAAGALLNIVVALTAFALARGGEPRPAVASGTDGVAGRMRLLLPVAAFITGATSFAYEIGWVRMLAMVFGSTMHAFEIMLAAFIGGLACGSAWIRRRIDQYSSPVRVGGVVQIAMGIAALASLVLYDHSFDAVAWAMRTLPKTASGYTLFNAGTAIGAIAIMAPTAFFAGMTLPLFTLALIRDGGGERSVGRIYSANTVGAIAGIYVAVHWLVPLAGLKRTMIVAAAGDLVLGLVLLRRFPTPARLRFPAAVAVCLAALVATALLAKFDPMAMGAGVYRNGKARFLSGSAEMVSYRDGQTASIAVIKDEEGELIISTNGKADASIQLRPATSPTLDEVTMIMAGTLPLATHPAPQTAAVIGFGSGLSTHTLLGDHRLRRVDTIEIEPAMVEGAKAFGNRNARAYDDPRSSIYFDDAKAYFASKVARYDIIVSEPSNPWVSGVGGLFSTEFYKFVPRHLNPGGLFVQWVQLYEINDELVAAIGRSLAESFTDYRVYLANTTDAIIIATARGTLPELNGGVFRQGVLGDELRRVGLASTEDLRLRQVGDRRSLLPMFDLLSQRTNSDFFPILSLEAPRERFVGSHPLALIGLAMSDLPMREVIGHIAPPKPGQFLPNPAYLPSLLAEQAALIAVGLPAGAAERADTPFEQFLEERRGIVAACADESADSRKIDALHQLVSRTVPYLEAEQLVPVWIDPHWITCATPTAAVRGMLDVMSSLAARDFTQAGSRAAVMLQDHRPALSVAARDWLLRLCMLAAIAEGRYADVATLDARLGVDIPAAGWNGMQRSYMNAFAEAQSVRTRTH